MNGPMGAAVAAALQEHDFPLMTLPQLHRLTPALDRLPLADAQARRCVLFREGTRWIAVLDNPLAGDVQRWVEARAGGFVDWHLARPDDLTAWLGRQEQGSSALASVAPQKPGVGGTAERAEEVSLVRIQQDASPVVRLVNSTLHDALKLGASDIHLEATATGLDIRLRIDGVLE